MGRLDTGGPFRHFLNMKRVFGMLLAVGLLPAIALLSAFTFLAACSRRPLPTIARETQPSVLQPLSRTAVIDGRGRFREIYCAVNAARGSSLPDTRPCEGDAALWRQAGEPAPTGLPVDLAPSAQKYLIVMVPGVMAECVASTAKCFEDAAPHLESLGYSTGYIQTGGRLSCARNAAIIRRAVLALPLGQRIILVTHSKGTPDSLDALAAYPEVAQRVAAVISVSGAVNGSPLAEVFSEAFTKFVGEFSWSACPPGPDAEAAISLRRSVRLAWLDQNRLPASVRYYSLAAFAEPKNISAALRPFYNTLAKTEPLNDGMVVCSDMIIPGSTLLGYPNADHLAVAMPFGRKSKLLGATLLNRNNYPREVLLEAAVRYVEEDLEGGGEARGQ